MVDPGLLRTFPGKVTTVFHLRKGTIYFSLGVNYCTFGGLFQGFSSVSLEKRCAFHMDVGFTRTKEENWTICFNLGVK